MGRVWVHQCLPVTGGRCPVTLPVGESLCPSGGLREFSCLVAASLLPFQSQQPSSSGAPFPPRQEQSLRGPEQTFPHPYHGLRPSLPLHSWPLSCAPSALLFSPRGARAPSSHPCSLWVVTGSSGLGLPAMLTWEQWPRDEASSGLSDGPKTYFHLLTLEPVNVTRVFASVIRLRICRQDHPGPYPCVTCWALTSNTRRRDARERKRSREDGGRDPGDAATSQGTPRIASNTRSWRGAWDRFLSRV